MTRIQTIDKVIESHDILRIGTSPHLPSNFEHLDHLKMNTATQHEAKCTCKHGEGMAVYAAPSLFQPHRARQAIRDAHEGKIPSLIGYYAGLSSVPITRWLSPMGFDAVWIDWEHSSCNTETMTTVCNRKARH